MRKKLSNKRSNRLRARGSSAERASVLWVRVDGDLVWLVQGPEMPRENPDFDLLSVWGVGGSSITRKEFARWSGLEFPPGCGVYGLRVTFAVVERYRAVVEQFYEVASVQRERLVRRGRR